MGKLSLNNYYVLKESSKALSPVWRMICTLLNETGDGVIVVRCS